jgi:hypothetical protein
MSEVSTGLPCVLSRLLLSMLSCFETSLDGQLALGCWSRHAQGGGHTGVPPRSVWIARPLGQLMPALPLLRCMLGPVLVINFVDHSLHAGVSLSALRAGLILPELC